MAVLWCMAPAGVEPAPRRLRVGRSPLSYGAERDVAGRSRTCGAPRFRRPLYPLSYSHKVDGRGWNRASCLERTAASPCDQVGGRWPRRMRPATDSEGFPFLRLSRYWSIWPLRDGPLTQHGGRCVTRNSRLVALAFDVRAHPDSHRVRRRLLRQAPQGRLTSGCLQSVAGDS